MKFGECHSYLCLGGILLSRFGSIALISVEQCNCYLVLGVLLLYRFDSVTVILKINNLCLTLLKSKNYVLKSMFLYCLHAALIGYIFISKISQNLTL